MHIPPWYWFSVSVPPVADPGHCAQAGPLPLGVHVGQFHWVGDHPALATFQPIVVFAHLFMVIVSQPIPSGPHRSQNDIMQLYAQYYGDWSDRHGSFTWRSLICAVDQCDLTFDGDAQRALADARARWPCCSTWRRTDDHATQHGARFTDGRGLAPDYSGGATLAHCSSDRHGSGGVRGSDNPPCGA